jgi:hypothetical protein
MKVKLLDYRYRAREVEIGDLDDIICAILEIRTGDETLNVIYKNGETAFFDSTDDRIQSFDDGSFIVYVEGSVNLLTSERFINRRETWDCVMLSENNKDMEGDGK